MNKLIATTAAAIFAVGTLAGCSGESTTSSSQGGSQAQSGSQTQGGSGEQTKAADSKKAYTTEDLDAIIGKVNGSNGPLQPTKSDGAGDQTAEQMKQMADQMEISPAECKEQAKKNLAGASAESFAKVPHSTAADTSGEGATMSVSALTLIDGSDASVKAAGAEIYPEKSKVEESLSKCGKITLGPAGQGMELTTTVEDAKVAGSDDSYATKTAMNIAGQAREQYTVWAKKGSLIASASSSDAAEAQRMAEEAVAQA